MSLVKWDLSGNFWKKAGDGNTAPPKNQGRLWLLLALAVVGVVLLLAASVVQGGKSDRAATRPQSQPEAAVSRTAAPLIEEQENILAVRLKGILSQVAGAGDVDVTVKLEDSGQEEYATNTTTNRQTTQEKDNGGGTRVITQDNQSGQLVLMRGAAGGGEVPVIKQQFAPKVAGVLVVAQGAGDPGVKEHLIRAVQVALDVPLYRILVLEKK